MENVSAWAIGERYSTIKQRGAPRADYGRWSMWPFPLSLIARCVLNRTIDYKLSLVLPELCIPTSYQYRSRGCSIIHIMFHSMEQGHFLWFTHLLCLKLLDTQRDPASHCVHVKTLTGLITQTEKQRDEQVPHQWTAGDVDMMIPPTSHRTEESFEEITSKGGGAWQNSSSGSSCSFSFSLQQNPSTSSKTLWIVNNISFTLN